MTTPPDLPPGWAEGLNALGVVWIKQGRFEKAMAVYNRIIDKKTDWYLPYLHRGIAARQLGFNDTALADFARAAELNPECPAAVDGELLRLGRRYFEEAWREWSALTEIHPAPAAAPGRLQPLWNGDPGPEKTLLLTSGDDLRDAIRFVRFAPLVHAQFGGRLLVETASGAGSLLATCRGVDGIVERGASCLADFQFPLASVPDVLRNVTAVPSEFPFLFPADALTSSGDAALSLIEEHRGKLRVGLVWRGAEDSAPAHAWSLSEFAALRPAGDVQFFSLQAGETEEESAILHSHGIVSLGIDAAGLARTAALLLRLDLIVAADGAIAELAGSIGIPGWVLTDRPADSRWMAEGTRSPWYPTLRLFAPERDESRAGFISRMRDELGQIARTPRFSRSLHRRKLHRFEIDGIPLLAYDEPGSLAACRIGSELLQDSYLLREIPFQPGDVVVDVGAHVGLVSIYLAARWPFLRILAFEPHPANYASCAENLRLNDIRNVSLSPEALSGDGRKLTMYSLPANTGGASAVFKLPGAAATAVVPSATLDDVLAGSLQQDQRCRLLKIDCEGMEYEILTGCRLLDRVDYLVGEFHEAVDPAAVSPDDGLVGDPEVLLQRCAEKIPRRNIKIVVCAKTD